MNNVNDKPTSFKDIHQNFTLVTWKKNVTLSAKIRFIHHHSQFSIWQFNLNVHANPRKFNSLVQKVQLKVKCSLLISPKRIYFTNEQREGNTKGSLKSKKCKQKCHAMQDFKGIIVLDTGTSVLYFYFFLWL